MKTSELTGAALDWAVAKCEGIEADILTWLDTAYPSGCYHYSTDWSQAGPIIERECICTYASGACSVSPKYPDYWVAEILETDGMRTQYGPTPLIAAMRCYVASKLGNEVDIPEELKEIELSPTSSV